MESADMTQEDIIRMAREADPKANLSEPYCLDHETRAWLERFAALVAAAEREACLNWCAACATDDGTAQKIDAAIRARREQA